MEKKQARKTAGRRALWALAVVLTVLLALAVVTAVQGYRDMRHEGRADSQWYEGSLAAWYRALALCILLGGGCVACWAALFGAGRALPRPGPRGQKALWILACLGLLGFCVFAFGAWRCGRQIALYRALNTDSPAPYLMARGRKTAAAFLFLEGGAAALWAALRSRRAGGRKQPFGQERDVI